MDRRIAFLFYLAAASFVGDRAGLAQSDYNAEPIHYDSRPPADRVQQLRTAIEAGERELTWDRKHGWLPAIMAALDVPSTSQTLVFSKTSKQATRIRPSRPRALYFNDDVYVGWVNNGDFVELAAVDPEQGAIFYTVDQIESDRPAIVRDRGECLSCHVSSRTQKVPGFLVRSVFPQSSGHPDFRLGTTTVDHTTAFEKRFGGWYVTGTHGEMKHRGNITFDEGEPNVSDPAAGANRRRLPGAVNADAYLEPTSDIVALMVLEHQSQMHNWVTNASYASRLAYHRQQTTNRLLEYPTDHVSDTTIRQINAAAEKLVRYLFFCDEYQLASPVQGNTSFTQEFSAIGRRDRRGRSLREFDLSRRLFRYPCSFLIYSDSFLALPDPILDRVIARMNDVLTLKDRSKDFSHLSAPDRRAIREILRDTHPLFSDSES